MSPWLVGDVEEFYDTTGDIKFGDEQEDCPKKDDERQENIVQVVGEPKKIEIVL